MAGENFHHLANITVERWGNASRNRRARCNEWLPIASCVKYSKLIWHWLRCVTVMVRLRIGVAMIDTICVAYPIELSSVDLKKFYKHETTFPVVDLNMWNTNKENRSFQDVERQRKVSHTAVFSTEDHSKSVQVTYYPENKSGFAEPKLLVEFSLPTLILGTNARMIYDVSQAVEQANEILRSIQNLPALDLSKGDLTRVDLCFNHQVGGFVQDYIHILSRLSYAHREPTRYKDSNVMFTSKERSTSFYDKQLDMKGDTIAAGILRQEQRLNNHGLIKEITGKGIPTIMDFDAPRIKQCLDMDLVALKLNDEKVCSYDDAYKQLKALHGSTVADRLYSFLIRSQGRSTEEMAETDSKSIRSMNRNFSKIAAAGVSRALAENMKPLPKLEIDFESSRYMYDV
jgi:hypothetical protein